MDHYRLGLPGMLITDLSQSRYVSVVREDRIFTTLVELGLYSTRRFSSKHLNDIAGDPGVSHIIQGSYIKIGDLLRIDIDIIKTSAMESVGTDKFETLESDLSSFIDELTKRIKPLLKLTDEAIGHDIDERVGKVITEKPEAYRLYIEGRNFHNLNEYEKSIDSMEKALVIDPGFALALRSISDSYYNMRLLSKSREYAEKALNLKERITERDRHHFELLFYKDMGQGHRGRCEASPAVSR